MPNFVRLLLLVLCLPVSAMAEESTELSSRFSVGAGAGVTVFSREAYEHHQTSLHLRGEWKPASSWSLVLGGSHTSQKVDFWREKEDSLFGHVQFHPFATAITEKGWDPYLLAGAAELFHTTQIDIWDYTFREHTTQVQAGLGTNFQFGKGFGAWIEAVSGREVTARKLHYGTSFSSTVGVKYSL